jgi:hypothetical protein
MSALAKSMDFGRQRDVYVLATKYRNRDMQRLWSDFAAEQPAMARLIIKDVDTERRTAAAANEDLDRRLARAEKVLTKNRKPKAAKSRKPKVTEAELGAIGLEAARETALATWLESSDPAHREMARAVLESRAR